MSKLQQLINRLCPNGVPHKPLGEIYKRVKGTSITAKQMKEIANDNGDVRIFAGGKTVVNAFSKDIRNANILNNPAVLIQSRGIIDVVYYDKPFTFKNEMWAYTNKSPVSLKFLFYFLKANIKSLRDKATAMGAFPQISIADTEGMLIPVPPIEVQEEIVRILDMYSARTAELQAKLQAELQARKEQYEYYRNLLLTFNPSACGAADDEQQINKLTSTPPDSYKITWKTMGEILDYEQPTKYIVKSTEYDDSYTIPVLTAGQSFILGYTDESFGIFNASKDNPVIIFDDFTTSFHWVDFDFKVKSSAMKILRPKSENVSFRFIFYAMSCIHFEPSQHTRHWISQYSQFTIPVPPLEVQERIVGILDRFEALVNDLTAGLPAEIAAEQERYEYYRNKLLTFKELA